MRNTQAPSGTVATADDAAAQEQHEVIYERALRGIAALDATWQEAVRGAAPAPAPAAVTPVVAPSVAAPAVVAPVVPPVPPFPRRPVTATAEITAIVASDTAEAVLARSGAPRWRRSLAY